MGRARSSCGYRRLGIVSLVPPLRMRKDRDRAELCSAYTTTKAEAFSGPLAFYDLDWLNSGHNTLPPGLVVLAEMYDELGHPELAKIVRSGQKYLRLNQLVAAETSAISVTWMWSLREAFLGEGDEEPSYDEWLARGLETFGDNPVLQALLAAQDEGAELLEVVEEETGEGEYTQEPKAEKEGWWAWASDWLVWGARVIGSGPSQ
jgi:hypothetical protein